jgi:two-component system sensor histidine kinase BaeS
VALVAAAARPGARAPLAALDARQRVRIAAARDRAAADQRSAIVAIATGGGLALLAALALVAALLASVRRPLDALVAASGRLAAGDLDARVPEDGPRELRQVAAAFNAMAAERARLEQLKDEFIATASHELRSPLTAVKGFVELLRATDGLSPQQREFVDIVHSSTQRLVELVDDLLDVARLDAGHAEVDRRPTDLGDVVAEVGELLRPRIEAKDQRLALDVADDLPPALADPVRMRQVLTNLLTNAHLYTPAGGTLTVGLRDGAAGLRLTVADTGTGMGPEELEHVFDRFVRVGRDPGGTGGSGLGLNIVRSLVELHDGRVEVRSAPGAGSTFTVTIPHAQGPRRAGGRPAIGSIGP